MCPLREGGPWAQVLAPVTAPRSSSSAVARLLGTVAQVWDGLDRTGEKLGEKPRDAADEGNHLELVLALDSVKGAGERPLQSGSFPDEKAAEVVRSSQANPPRKSVFRQSLGVERFFDASGRGLRYGPRDGSSGEPDACRKWGETTAENPDNPPPSESVSRLLLSEESVGAAPDGVGRRKKPPSMASGGGGGGPQYDRCGRNMVESPQMLASYGELCHWSVQPFTPITGLSVYRWVYKRRGDLPQTGGRPFHQWHYFLAPLLK